MARGLRQIEDAAINFLAGDYMSKTEEWIGRHLSLGGLVRNAGSGLGTITKYAVTGAGAAATLIASEPATKKKIHDSCTNAGDAVDSAITKGSLAAGAGINKGVQVASVAVGRASGGVARIFGASEENIALAEGLGTVVGAVTVGVIVGSSVANAAVVLGAAVGTAGGAATTSGLAALGGGSVAAGGGGMAAGQAVVQGMVAAGGVSGAATLKKDKSGEQSSK